MPTRRPTNSISVHHDGPSGPRLESPLVLVTLPMHTNLMLHTPERFTGVRSVEGPSDVSRAARALVATLRVSKAVVVRVADGPQRRNLGPSDSLHAALLSLSNSSYRARGALMAGVLGHLGRTDPSL